MKRFLPILMIFVLAMAGAASAVDPASWWNTWALYFTGADGKPSAVTPINGLPVAMAGIASMSNPGIISSALYTGTLATNAVTLVSGIASLATNDIIEIQVSATSYRGPAGTASGTLQSYGIKMSVDDTFSYRYAGADLALIADPAAVSTLKVQVYKDR